MAILSHFAMYEQTTLRRSKNTDKEHFLHESSLGSTKKIRVETSFENKTNTLTSSKL